MSTSQIDPSYTPVAPADECAPIFPVGSLLSVRLRGHRETDGEDYLAPAVVLKQWPDGNLRLYVFDLFGQGLQNIYDWHGVASTLFDPDTFSLMVIQLPNMQARILVLEQAGARLDESVTNLQSLLEGLSEPVAPTAPVAAPPAPPVTRRK